MFFAGTDGVILAVVAALILIVVIAMWLVERRR